MIIGSFVNIELTNGSYVVKSKNEIAIGEFVIIECSKSNNSCTFRIVFNKSEEKSQYLNDALECFIKHFFMDLDVNKINLLVREDFHLQPFVNANFHLEGILTNNVIYQEEYLTEFLFGIDIDTYNKLNRSRIVTLKGKNIELKVLMPEDASEVLSYYIRNEAHLQPYEPLRNQNFYTIEEQKKNIGENYIQFLNGTSISFGIFRTGNLIGKIQITNILLGAFRNAFIGYSIDEREQGKGYMKEALRIVSNYAFDEMELHRLEASTLVDNIKSKAVLKACGFKEIGISEKYLFINGVWQDHSIFYSIRENWRANT